MPSWRRRIRNNWDQSGGNITRRRKRARAILDLSNHGTPVLETYAEIFITGAVPAVRQWEMEAAGEELGRMRDQDADMVLEWSWGVLGQAGFDDRWRVDWDL